MPRCFRNTNSTFVQISASFTLLLLILSASTSAMTFNLTKMSLISPSSEEECIHAHEIHLPAAAHATCKSVRFVYGTSFGSTHDQIHHSSIPHHHKREHEHLYSYRDTIVHPTTKKRPPIQDHHSIDTLRHMDDGVYPAKEVVVRPYAIDKTAVTNEEFGIFVKEKKWTTGAEKNGWSYVLDSLLPTVNPSHLVDPHNSHWVAVPGAYWRNPLGLNSTITNSMSHPVVHVNYKDAAAYCKWRGLRLPGDREYEFETLRWSTDNPGWFAASPLPTLEANEFVPAQRREVPSKHPTHQQVCDDAFFAKLSNFSSRWQG